MNSKRPTCDRMRKYVAADCHAPAHDSLLRRVCVVAATLLLLSAQGNADSAQIGETLSQVKRVYVGSLGDKQGATELRGKLLKRLRKTHEIEIVANAGEADAILTGTGEIWLQGYISTNPKPSPYNRQPVYGGYLSVELRGKDNVVFWSAVIKPGAFRWNGVPQDLVNRLVKKLNAALHQNGSLRH
jgi:hypothetical protein